MLNETDQKHATIAELVARVKSKCNMCCCSLSVFLTGAMELTIFGWIFLHNLYDRFFFFNPTTGEVTFRLCEWCMRGMFFLKASTCLEHECQDLGSLCDGMYLCRLDLHLLFYPKEYGVGSESTINSEGKIPSIGYLWKGLNQQCCITQNSKPDALQAELIQSVTSVPADDSCTLTWTWSCWSRDSWRLIH